MSLPTGCCDDTVTQQHYTFLRLGEINHDDGGRGVYLRDPDSHFLEVITRRYGGDTDPPAKTR